MAICQWDSKFTVWAAGVSSLLWWKVLEERKKFSMSTTTNTVTPRCALCCPRWAVIEHFIGSALFSNPEIQVQVCSPGRPAEPRRRRGGRDLERGRRGHRAAALHLCPRRPGRRRERIAGREPCRAPPATLIQHKTNVSYQGLKLWSEGGDDLVTPALIGIAPAVGRPAMSVTQQPTLG